MSKTNLKKILSILLIGTGVLHLAVAAFGAPPDIRLPLAAFGAFYSALGFWVRSGVRASVVATIVVTLAGLGLGGANFLQNGGPVTLPVMFLIDFAILGAGGLWLAKSGD